MRRHQHAEAAGLVSFLFCAIIGGVAMALYQHTAPAIWLVSRRLFMAFSAIVAASGVVSFIVGYAGRSRSLTLDHGWIAPLRRIIEILALSIVYASTLFLTIFMVLGVVNDLMGRAFVDYMIALCACFSGIAGYVTFVQASLMNAKTVASLLPFFVVSGVSTAGMTSDDPYWYHNNFSQLGDRTTFAASMFNWTLIMAGICIVIISYFAISELLTTYRMRRMWPGTELPGDATGEIGHFKARMGALSTLLTLSGIAFVGIGTFRYTPHPIMHNVFARGLPGIMTMLLIGLPWLVPQLSRVMYVASDLSIALTGLAGVYWLMGGNTLTSVEAMAGMLFLGWFIVFSRQIAAIEADRLLTQLMHTQTAGLSEPVEPTSDAASPVLESRLAADR
jgi:hypothetical membrane protein